MPDSYSLRPFNKLFSQHFLLLPLGQGLCLLVHEGNWISLRRMSVSLMPPSAIAPHLSLCTVMPPVQSERCACSYTRSAPPSTPPLQGIATSSTAMISCLPCIVTLSLSPESFQPTCQCSWISPILKTQPLLTLPHSPAITHFYVCPYTEPLKHCLHSSDSLLCFLSGTFSKQPFVPFMSLKPLLPMSLVTSLLPNWRSAFNLTAWQHLTQLPAPSFANYFLYMAL